MSPVVRNITSMILDYAKAKGCDAVSAWQGAVPRTDPEPRSQPRGSA